MIEKDFLPRILGMVLYFVLIGNHLPASGQTIHFSQAFDAHLILNPANTGRFNGDWRAVGSYRNQGVDMLNDYSTAYISFEKPFYVKAGKINAGGYYSRDNSAGGTFPVDRINFSLASGVWLTDNSKLDAGIQFAYVHKQVKWDGITFPDQYNRETGGFDPSIPTSDLTETSKTSHVDLGFGLVYSLQLDKSVVSFGYSIQQMNQPTENLFNLEDKLPMKHFWHLKTDINLNPSLFVIPTGVLMKQGKNNSFLYGLHMGYTLDWWNGVPNSLIGGVHVRNASFHHVNSLVFSAGITWQYYKVMVSYDVPKASTGSSSFNNSAIEFSLGFRIPSTDLTYKTIPCERY